MIVVLIDFDVMVFMHVNPPKQQCKLDGIISTMRNMT